MEFPVKQWKKRNQHESEQQQPSVKMPKLLLDTYHLPQPHLPQPPPPAENPSASTAPLPLFLPESTTKTSNLSAHQDSTSPAATTRFPRMGGNFFSLAQWQELELQALIYRYMLAGSTVPPELLQPIKKSLLSTSYNFLHHPLQHYTYYQPAPWNLGRAAMDPEPGRCRRTDGKKWRCSRDVVEGQKYCERHVHRGRNRSRKPVEIPTSTTSTVGGGGGGGGCGAASAAFNISTSIVSPSLVAVTNGTGFSFSGQSPSVDLLRLSNCSSDSKPEIKGLLGPQTRVTTRNDGHILRHFFDDWPGSLQEPGNVRSTNSPTCLSISMLGNSSSDVSLKLSTGNVEEPAGTRGRDEREQPQVNWTGGWGTTQVSSMGGPLAEALRSSTSNSSPTSVLHRLPRGSASETSYIIT